MLRESFFASLEKYSQDQKLNFTLWSDIEISYGKSGRHYHTLIHLDHLFRELAGFKDKFTDWDSAIFAIAYHDIIYNTLKSNNEERSAALATETLTKLAVPEITIRSCSKFILATKRHELADLETNLFTDADLSILGSDVDTYTAYAKQIRKEYSIYPDLIYNPGRIKVLQHFLEMESIFKTLEFSSRYEKNARFNLQHELSSMIKMNKE